MRYIWRLRESEMFGQDILCNHHVMAISKRGRGEKSQLGKKAKHSFFIKVRYLG